jgi:hypothetical protein
MALVDAVRRLHSDKVDDAERLCFAETPDEARVSACLDAKRACAEASALLREILEKIG